MSQVFGTLKNGAEGAFSVVQGKIQLKNLLCHLRAEVKILEKDCDERTAALGRTVYAMHRSGRMDLSSVNEQLQAIERIEGRLKEKQKEIDACFDALHGTSHTRPAAERCRGCGSPMADTARYCSTCGHSTADPGRGSSTRLLQSLPPRQ
ncbi:MAG TPA: hypothetical protein VFJ58_22540 [Armatimonadota bacterium]|nr:hypothetical protein [Armatimonadota bacterium]